MGFLPLPCSRLGATAWDARLEFTNLHWLDRIARAKDLGIRIALAERVDAVEHVLGRPSQNWRWLNTVLITDRVLRGSIRPLEMSAPDRTVQDVGSDLDTAEDLQANPRPSAARQTAGPTRRQRAYSETRRPVRALFDRQPAATCDPTYCAHPA